MQLDKTISSADTNANMEQRIANQVFQNINQGIIITDYRGKITKANRRFLNMAGYKEEQLIGMHFSNIRHLHYPKEFFKDIVRVIREKGKWQGEIENKDSEGNIVPEYLSIYPVRNENGDIRHYFGIFIDLKEIKEKEKALWEAKNQLQTILEYSPLGMIVCDKNGHITIWNKQAEHILEYTRETAIGQSVQQFIPNYSCPFHMGDSNISYELQRNEIRTITASGQEKVLQLSCSPIFDQHQKINGFQIIFSDMTDYKEAKKRIEYFKNYDQNTGLYNHDFFYQYIHNYIEEHSNKKSAVLVMDLDRFHIMNKKFGSRFADKIIEEAGKKIKSAVGQSGIVASLKGDEFGCFLPNVEKEEQIIDTCREIFASFNEPLLVKGQPVHITLSMGVSIYPNDGDHYEQLSITANIALSRAKKERNIYQLYDKSMHDDGSNFYYENELHRALKEEKLEVHYQPQVDLKTNTLYGVEALLRWKHPKEGYIPPNIFIPIAEESGLIVPLTEFVVRQVCEDYIQWKKREIHIPNISINLSANQFYNKDFVEKFIAILDSYNVPKHIVHIEITESVAMDIQNSLENLNKLKQHGIKISIDDFGTGYSSLKYLQELPIDFLKIDKSFVKMIAEGKSSMVDFIIHVAKASGMEVVGEGVETKDVDQYLKTNGCTVGQGFYYSKPLPPQKLMEQFTIVG